MFQLKFSSCLTSEIPPGVPITKRILNSTMVRFLAHLLEIELAIEMAPRHRHGIPKHAACLKIELAMR